MQLIIRVASFFFVLLFLSTVFACSTSPFTCGANKDGYLDKYYAFVQEVRDQQKKGNLSNSQWEAYDKQFNLFTDGCYHAYATEFTNSDKLGIAACTAFYLYAKHGMMLVTEIAKQEAVIKDILSEIDPMLMIKIAKEILNNPEEVKNILNDLEKRYG